MDVYLLGGNKQQLAVYNGRETSEADACSNNSHRVHYYPMEYLTYGNGGSVLITTRPNNFREYKIVDHLGSTRVVLDSNGAILSTYDFEPFGKPLAKTGLDSRKSFIDREKDKESNLGNFGVRSYDADGGGRFTSIDPLWEKFRAWNPYQYSINNPLSIVDREGKEIEFLNYGKDLEKAKVAFNSALTYLENNGANEQAGILRQLRDRKDILVHIRVEFCSALGYEEYKPTQRTIFWNPNAATESEGSRQSPALALLHEGAHALRHLDAVKKSKEEGHTSKEELQFYKDLRPNGTSFANNEEQRVIQQVENPAAKCLGEGIRTSHGGTPYRSLGPVSTTPTQNIKEKKK